MLALLEQNQERIRAICQKHFVRRLDVFGSATDEESFDPATSDVDFIVEYHDEARSIAWDCYWGLKCDLEAILGRSVDLVMATAVRNPYFIASMNQTRKLLYAA